MTDLEFIRKLSDLGIQVPYDKLITYDINKIFGGSEKYSISTDGEVHYPSTSYGRMSINESLIRDAINCGEWKHSYHYDTSDRNNYDKFLEIIRLKILEESALLLKLTSVSNLIENLIKERCDEKI